MLPVHEEGLGLEQLSVQNEKESENYKKRNYFYMLDFCPVIFLSDDMLFY